MDNANQQVPPISDQHKNKTSNSNLSFLKIISYGFVIISVGILIAVGGYWFGGLQKNNKMSISNRTPINSASVQIPTPTIFVEKNFEKRIAHNLGVYFRYPNNWTDYQNGTPRDQITKLNLPVNNISGKAFEIVSDNKGCVFYIAAESTGGDGPTVIATVGNVIIDGKTFVKRSWFHKSSDKIPFFSYYFPEGHSQDVPGELDAIWTFIPEEGAAACQNQIDQILSTFKFTK
jgi:hypothetical protein